MCIGCWRKWNNERLCQWDCKLRWAEGEVSEIQPQKTPGNGVLLSYINSLVYSCLFRALTRYVATWDYSPCRDDELELNRVS